MGAGEEGGASASTAQSDVGVASPGLPAAESQADPHEERVPRYCARVCVGRGRRSNVQNSHREIPHPPSPKKKKKKKMNPL